MLRAKKTLFTMFLLPCFIPVMVFLYCYLMENPSVNEYKIGIDYKLSTAEENIIKETQLSINNYSSKQKMNDAYENSEIDGYIDYNSDQNIYTIYVNEDSEDGMYVSSLINDYLEKYNNYLASNYLTEQGLDANKVNNMINITTVDLEGENMLLKMIFSMAFTYIIMAIVTSSINTSINITASEKENGTLETILTFPIKKSELIIGKLIATIILGFIAGLIGLAFTLSSIFIARIMFNVLASINYSISIINVLLSILVILSAAILIGGLSILLTSLAKSYKEAQSKAQLLTFVSILPLFVSLLNVPINSYYYLIPVVNFTQILMDMFLLEFSYSNLAIIIVSSLIYTIFIIKFIIKQYNSEKILFAK